MIFSNEILMELGIVVLGVFGFLVAKHIRSHKIENTPLVCMVGFDCHTVVHSDYSRFLGVPVEILGMIYYAFIALVYTAFIIKPELVSYTYALPFSSIMMFISLVGFLFSSYLIAIQIFVLKKGCSWCIVSAFISALIFVLTVIK